MATTPKPSPRPQPSPQPSQPASPASSPPRNPPPSPSTGQVVSPPPGPAGAPVALPGAKPPPPLAPRKPKGQAPAPLPSPAAAPSPYQVLPKDPAARLAALATVESESRLVLSMLDLLASRLPPQRPLSDPEKEMIKGPLDEVLYKYGGQIPCEWALAISIAFVGFGRYMEYRTLLENPPKKAAA